MKPNIKKNTIAQKKSESQVFLRSKTIALNIATFADLNDKVVIEIGGGDGFLTKYLVMFAKEVLVIEKDKRFKDTLLNIVKKDTNVTVQDVLNMDLDLLIEKRFPNSNPYIYGNLPYKIATLIILKCLQMKNCDFFVFMVQKEFANKITSKNKTLLSYILESYSEYNILLNVNKNCFKPRPKIDSSVVVFQKRKMIKELSNKQLEFIKTCLKSKRKTLLNNISNPIQKEIITKWLIKKNKPLLIRAEKLSLSDFRELFVLLKYA